MSELEEIAAFHSLLHAAHGARRGKRMTAASARFFVDIEGEVLALERELRAGTWQPGPFRSFVVKDAKPRLISAAPFRDRVVHHALCAAIGPALDDAASDASFACRKGRGTAGALKKARAIVRDGAWFLKLDVRRYFETIDHGVLLREVGPHIPDEGVFALLTRIVVAGAPGSPMGKGLPIGNLTSQHLANAYLTSFDHRVVACFPEVGYVRYMDDLLFVGADRATLKRVEHFAREALEGDLRLAVKDEATRRGPVKAGVPFLGLRLWPAWMRLDGARKRRLARRLRAVERDLRLDGDEVRAGMRAASLVGWAASAAALPLVRGILKRQR